MKSRAPAQQKGFTLVEIAIVLVIIGLLLGGVLKGQALIEGSKVKAVVNDLRGVATISNVYLDKYRAVPGDDLLVQTHLGTTTATIPTTGAGVAGNGQIDNTTGDWTGVATPTATNESSLFWQHSKIAGLAAGAAGGQYNNSSGGFLGVISPASTLRITSPGGSRGSLVTCASSIPGSIASQVDSAMDDGVGSTGNVYGRAGVVVTNLGATGWDQTSSFTLCSQS